MSQPLKEEQLSRLRSEATAPYQSIRRFVYLALGASASLGAFVFLMKAIALENLEQTLPNLLLQVGISAVMIALWNLDHPPQQ
jgi:hypothetical protein